MGFGSSFKKAGFGGNHGDSNDWKGGRGGDWKNQHHEGGGRPDFGNHNFMDNEDAPEKKFIPPAPEGDKDGGEQPGKKEENGNQTEVIEEVLELFDQLTPLIEKLRSK